MNVAFEDPDIVSFTLYNNGVILTVNHSNLLDSMDSHDDEAVIAFSCNELHTIISLDRPVISYYPKIGMVLNLSQYYINPLDQLLLSFSRDDLAKQLKNQSETALVFAPFSLLDSLFSRLIELKSKRETDE